MLITDPIFDYYLEFRLYWNLILYHSMWNMLSSLKKRTILTYLT